jgi:S1-C subfamily serine protease
MRGEVVGVNTLGSNAEQAQNLNFAVSVIELRALLKKTASP